MFSISETAFGFTIVFRKRFRLASDQHMENQMSAKPISLKILAAHLDLTVGTVSRALNGYADISSVTRERVKRAADELG